MTKSWRITVGRILLLLCFTPTLAAAEQPDRAQELIGTLEKLAPGVLKSDEKPGTALASDITERLKQANRQSTATWRAISTKAEWEAFRAKPLAALRESLGPKSSIANPPAARVVGEINQDGYSIRLMVYESRPGMFVTANLYVPAAASPSMPGILLSHSHHAPKSQGELQDMGALWARAGCLVLVPDHLGHGERRQHPFLNASDYPEKFQVGRQDYHFRYNTATQLYLIGESLMGTLARDLSRGVDVLLAQPGIDPQRIAIFGAVAGGGDPAAVAAALDERITLVAPFNFGGPQPESRYPLPEDSEDSFNYVGGGGWESTRNLYHSASGGFLPWVIVGSVAPRGVIHAHEFSWDQAHDPVWQRYQKIFGFYKATDRLGFTHGFGTLRQQPPQASHCDNIGKPHRERIHEHLVKAWGITVDEQRPVQRRSAAELACLTKRDAAGLANKPLYEVASHVAVDRRAQLAAQLNATSVDKQLDLVRAAWTKLLGNIEPPAAPQAESRGVDKLESALLGKVRVERWVLAAERGIRLPLMLLLPEKRTDKMPVVLAIAQGGKQAFLSKRAELLSQLLPHAAVCLVDVRGTGATKTDSDRGRRSEDTDLAASELMLGSTLLAARLRDVRTALAYLRTRPEFGKVAVLGESLQKVNGPDVVVNRPLDLDQPAQAEPLGPLLTLLAGLFEPQPLVVATRGGLIDYHSLLESPFIHLPLDVIVPGAAASADLPLVAAAVGRHNPLWIGGLVDGRNQAASTKQVAERYGDQAQTTDSDEDLAKWLIGELLKP